MMASRNIGNHAPAMFREIPKYPPDTQTPLKLLREAILMQIYKARQLADKSALR